jgi:hypothetical protein
VKNKLEEVAALAVTAVVVKLEHVRVAIVVVTALRFGGEEQVQIDE